MCFPHAVRELRPESDLLWPHGELENFSRTKIFFWMVQLRTGESQHATTTCTTRSAGPHGS
jgi:hypothetical protein